MALRARVPSRSGVESGFAFEKPFEVSQTVGRPEHEQAVTRPRREARRRGGVEGATAVDGHDAHAGACPHVEIREALPSEEVAGNRDPFVFVLAKQVDEPGVEFETGKPSDPSSSGVDTHLL